MDDQIKSLIENEATSIEEIISSARATHGEHFAVVVIASMNAAQILEVIAAISSGRLDDEQEQALVGHAATMLARMCAAIAADMPMEKIREAQSLTDVIFRRKQALEGKMSKILGSQA